MLQARRVRFSPTPNAPTQRWLPHSLTRKSRAHAYTTVTRARSGSPIVIAYDAGGWVCTGRARSAWITACRECAMGVEQESKLEYKIKTHSRPGREV
jgi:hypothetical protein